jgi:alkanesulfonate monooxygenase SsuD/methylene tetrahydromethanopterin reductase-like flavin-dependent oxidoreductase (luciferase family)
MQFGVHVFPTQYSFQPDELARAVEDRGLDSLWFSEHTHIPIRFCRRRGGPSPNYYWQTSIFPQLLRGNKKLKLQRCFA